MYNGPKLLTVSPCDPGFLKYPVTLLAVGEGQWGCGFDHDAEIDRAPQTSFNQRFPHYWWTLVVDHLYTSEGCQLKLGNDLQCKVKPDALQDHEGA